MVDTCLCHADSTDTSLETITVRLSPDPNSFQSLIDGTQKRIAFPCIEYGYISEKPQENFEDLVDTVDLNFAPKLREKHNARRPWSNESLYYLPTRGQIFPEFQGSFSKMIICASLESIPRRS